MKKSIDMIARSEGENFILTPVSKSAREWLSLKFTGTSEILVDFIEVDSATLGKVVRFCDGAGYRVTMF